MDLGYDWPDEVFVGMSVRLAGPETPDELRDQIGTVVAIDERGDLIIQLRANPRIFVRHVHIEEVEAV